MKISVIGLGYIGLPTAAIFASNGFSVNGIDLNEEIVSKVNDGKIHIVEPHLENLVKEAIKKGYLKAQKEISESDVYIIAVPTPFKENHEPDLTYVESAIKSLSKYLKKKDLVIIESTCPVGTTEKMSKLLSEIRPDLKFPEYKDEKSADISIVYCPERVLPGNIIDEFNRNDRIIGGVSKKCSIEALKLYKNLIKAECFVSDCRTAELVKLAENSFRDVNIAFANELSIISDDLKIDVRELINLANKHPRVNILSPGAGVGGHCIAVDPWFIVHSAPENSKIIKSAREINDEKPIYLLNKIKGEISDLNKKPRDLTISTFGLSFKPDIDDLRESPALEISKSLNQIGFKKHNIVEPNIDQLPKGIFKPGDKLIGFEEALNADILIFLVNHSEFKKIKMDKIKNKLIFDISGILS
tara:strand:- start:1215 stop:2459 length:1245 start_codon:yes stop_codon:yes gene_type:complete